MNPTLLLDALERRIEELETKLMFQEDTIQVLNQVLTETRQENIRNTTIIQSILNDLSKLRPSEGSDVSQEPPPPHY